MSEYKTFRLSIQKDLHQSIKLLAIRRRMSKLPLSSISDIVGNAISSWLQAGEPEIETAPPPESDGIQTTFKLQSPEVTRLYNDAILKRLETNPKRRSGARLDRQETDSVLNWWLEHNGGSGHRNADDE